MSIRTNSNPQKRLPNSTTPYFSKLYFNSQHQLALNNHRPEENNNNNNNNVVSACPRFLIIPHCRNMTHSQRQHYEQQLTLLGAKVISYQILVASNNNNNNGGGGLKTGQEFDNHFEKIKKVLVENTSATAGGIIVICDIPTLQNFKSNITSLNGDEAKVMFKLVDLLFEMKNEQNNSGNNENKKYPRLICAVHSKWLTDHCFPLQKCFLPIPHDLFSLYDDPEFEIPQDLFKGKNPRTDFLYFHLKNSRNSAAASQPKQPSSVSLQQQFVNPFVPQNDTLNNMFSLMNSASTSFEVEEDESGSNLQQPRSNSNSNQSQPSIRRTNGSSTTFNNNNHHNSSSRGLSMTAAAAASEAKAETADVVVFGGIFGQGVVDFDNAEEEEKQNADFFQNQKQFQTFLIHHEHDQQREPEARPPQDNFIDDGRDRTNHNNINNNFNNHNNANNNVFTRQIGAKLDEGRKWCRNQELVDHLKNLSGLTNASVITEADRFRAMVYRKAAYQIECIPFRLERADEIPEQFRKGIGEQTMKKIDEFLIFGTTQKFVSLQTPEVIAQQKLIKIWGIGPKTAKKLVEGYRVYDINQLRNNDAALASLTPNQTLGLRYYEDLNQRIPRAEVDLLQTLVAKTLARCGYDTHVESSDITFKSSCDVTGRSASSAAASIMRNSTVDLETGKRILTRGHVEVVTCGSFRRGHSNSGDVDILISSDDNIYGQFMDLIINTFNMQHAKRHSSEAFFKNELPPPRQPPHLPEEFDLFEKLIDGNDHASARNTEIHTAQTWMGIVRMEKCLDPKGCPCLHKPDGSHYARRLDLKAYRSEHIAFAKLYFTGSAFFNRALRWYAVRTNFRLSDSALCLVRRDNAGNIFVEKCFACKSEREIFQALKLDRYLEPHERDVTGNGFTK